MRLFMLTAVTMSLFAANGLLCRMALAQTDMDAASFTILRIVSGAVMLLVLTARRRGKKPGASGNFKAATALFAYMLAFSLAYRGLTAATGTLILVASILLTSIAASRFLGEGIRKQQLLGMAITCGGLIVLLTPSLANPSPLHAFLMGCSGASWVAYTILGKKNIDPALDTAGIFTRCLPFALLLLPFVKDVPLDGALCAILSGAVASGLGYILWYRLVLLLSTVTAALVQLSTPVLAALGGRLFLGEAVTARLFIGGAIIIGGIAYAQFHAVRHMRR